MHYRGNGLPKRKSGHWLGGIGISIALLACVITAWGHGSPGDEGYEADHDRYRGFDIHHTHSTTFDADGNPKSDENNWHWHWHLNTDNVSHEDRTDGTGVYDSDGTHGEVHVEHVHEYINEEGDSHSNLHLHKNMNVDDSHHTFGRVNGEGHDGEVDEPWTPEPEPPMPEPETPEPEPPATSRPRSNPTPSTCHTISPTLRFRSGYSLGHFPVVSTPTKSAGSFHESYSGKRHGVKVYTFDEEWHTYDSSDDAGGSCRS